MARRARRPRPPKQATRSPRSHRALNSEPRHKGPHARGHGSLRSRGSGRVGGPTRGTRRRPAVSTARRALRGVMPFQPRRERECPQRRRLHLRPSGQGPRRGNARMHAYLLEIFQRCHYLQLQRLAPYSPTHTSRPITFITMSTCIATECIYAHDRTDTRGGPTAARMRRRRSGARLPLPQPSAWPPWAGSSHESCTRFGREDRIRPTMLGRAVGGRAVRPMWWVRAGDDRGERGSQVQADLA